MQYHKIAFSFIACVIVSINTLCLDKGLESAIIDYIRARESGNVAAIVSMYDEQWFRINNESTESTKRNDAKAPVASNQLTKEQFENSLMTEYKEKKAVISRPVCFVQKIEGEKWPVHVVINIRWKYGEVVDVRREGFSWSGHSPVDEIESLYFIKEKGVWRITQDKGKALRTLSEKRKEQRNELLYVLANCGNSKKTGQDVIDISRKFCIETRLLGCEETIKYFEKTLSEQKSTEFDNDKHIRDWCQTGWVDLISKRTWLLSEETWKSAKAKLRCLEPENIDSAMDTFLNKETWQDLKKKKVEIWEVAVREPEPSGPLASSFEKEIWKNTEKDGYLDETLFWLETPEGLKFVGFYVPKVN